MADSGSEPRDPGPAARDPFRLVVGGPSPSRAPLVGDPVRVVRELKDPIARTPGADPDAWAEVAADVVVTAEPVARGTVLDAPFAARLARRRRTRCVLAWLLGLTVLVLLAALGVPA